MKQKSQNRRYKGVVVAADRCIDPKKHYNLLVAWNITAALALYNQLAARSLQIPSDYGRLYINSPSIATHTTPNDAILNLSTNVSTVQHSESYV